MRTAKTIMEEGPFAEEEYDDSVSSEEVEERMTAMEEGLRAAQDGTKSAQYDRDSCDVFRKKSASVQAELSERRQRQLVDEVEDAFDEIYERRSTEYIDKGAFLQTVNEVIRWQGGENEIFTILITPALGRNPLG